MIDEINDNDNVSEPRSLSKAATAEILGENLCVLFAIGKDGKMVRYYPEGFDFLTFDIDNQNITSEVNIQVRIPKCCLQEEPNIGFFEGVKLMFAMARCRCQIDGRCCRCP